MNTKVTRWFCDIKPDQSVETRNGVQIKNHSKRTIRLEILTPVENTMEKPQNEQRSPNKE